MLRKSRQRRAAWVIGAVQVLVAAAVVGAQSAAGDGPGLEQLVRAAMARDVALEKLQLDVRNKQLVVARGAAEKGFGLSLTLGSGESNLAGVSLADIGGEEPQFEVNYGIDTSVTADLPHPFGSISTTAAFRCTRNLDDDGKCTGEGQWLHEDIGQLNLTSKVEQPINSLLGLDAMPAADLEAAHGVVQAERAVRARERAIAEDILGRMKTILGRMKTARSGEHELAKRKDEVTRRRDVLQDNQESHSFQTLLFELEKERRGLETTQRRLEQDLDAFEQRTGTRRFGELTEALLELPAAAAVERAPEVVDAAVDLRVSEYRIREDENSRWPALTFNTSYDWPNNELSAGVGLTFKLPIFDGGQRQIKNEELNNAVASARLDGSSARRSFAEALIDLERRIQDLDHRSWEHRENTRLAALKVLEAKAALDAGVAVPSTLADAESAHQLLALDGEMLRVDRWLLKLELDALTDAELDFTAVR